MLLARDRALLDGFRAGRPDALKTVYLHYQPRVAGYLRRGFSFHSDGRVLRFRGFASPHALETATQETMARAFLPAARVAYDGLRPYADYLLAIARNFVLNDLRRVDRLDLVADDAALDAAGGPATDAPRPVETTLEEREVARLLAAFVSAAAPAERELYRLRFDEELGQEETARRLGLTRIQVRRLEHKLKRRLLDHLKAHGYLADVPRDILGVGLQSLLGLVATGALLGGGWRWPR